MSYSWKPYVTAAERRKKAEKGVAKAKNKGGGFSPVVASRGAIAKTFWGQAWCDNLERYSDYANRLPRGRTYVRNGSVVDLNVMEGNVLAQVMGSSLYQVSIEVAPVPKKHWQSIGSDCAGSIDSMVELLQGRLSKAVMERICKPGTGLFPSPKEIQFDCSCPDWADMCKHVAAALYGVGARLDAQPELIFSLRGVDALDLVERAGAGLPKSAQRPRASKVLDDALLADVFGIELVNDVAPEIERRNHTEASEKTQIVARAKSGASATKAGGTERSPKPIEEARAALQTTLRKVSLKAPAGSREPPSTKRKSRTGHTGMKANGTSTANVANRVGKRKGR